MRFHIGVMNMALRTLYENKQKAFHLPQKSGRRKASAHCQGSPKKYAHPNCSHSQAVKTSPFHGDGTGSNPVGSTKQVNFKSVVSTIYSFKAYTPKK